VLLTVFNCKERTTIDRKTKKTPLLRTVKEMGGNIHFWKICAIKLIVGNSVGIFGVVGTMLGTFYVFKGDLLLGASYGAMIGTTASLITLAGVPMMNWMCRRYQKHNAMRFALSMMIIGCILKWWCYNPDHPEYQFILPFFFSFGISGLMLVLGTMMADVTDVDELACGARREGMFGAVTAVVVRWISIFGTVAAGAMVSISGFNIQTGPDQAPGVFTTMRLLFSFIPGVLLCSCFLILWRYPLTEERMKEIKAELARRHQDKT
jgi:glycoside/pentoside/hexuronide:cation symporter, GPH family